MAVPNFDQPDVGPKQGAQGVDLNRIPFFLLRL